MTMGFAEQKFADYLRKNNKMMQCINVDDMLNQLRAVFTLSVAEQLERDLDRRGNLRTVNNFLLELQKRDDWVNNLLRALWECEHRELFETLQAEYRSYRPLKRVWEPPSHSLPSLPNNHYDLPQPDVPPPCASLPPQLNPSIPQPQSPPVAPSPNQVQPEETPRLSHQPQNSSDPSTVSRAPTLPSRPSAPASAHPVSLPDLVDTRKSGDDISKAPVPESTPFQPAPFSEGYGFLSEGTNSSERYVSEPCLPPARENTSTTPLEKQEVVRPVEKGVSIANSPGKYSAADLPHTSVYPKVAERDTPSPPNHSTSSIHSVYNASMAPLQRELPNYAQVTLHPSASQFSDASDTRQSCTVESVSNPVTSSPSQHLPEASVRSGAYAGAGQQRREQSTYRPNEHQSSCRPTDDDSNWALGKPEVLMSSVEAECPPLSRIPELEISFDESNNLRLQPSASSHSPATRVGKGNPPPRESATTSTPKTANTQSSPKKNPEENEEPRGASSSSHGRTFNVLQEPEENSFEISRDLSFYRIQFNEDPSVDLMAENNVPRLRTMNSSETNDTSDRDKETFDEKERPRESNLHNPFVITLAATVVCLSLYIIWLKHKN